MQHDTREDPAATPTEAPLKDTPATRRSKDVGRGIPLFPEPGRGARRQRSSPSFLSGHIPALDGIRGMAVILVLCRHASATFDPVSLFGSVVHRGMRSGWIGVDIFFALSG